MILSPTPEVAPLAVDADGVMRVGKTRVTLDTVIASFADGATAEEIAQQYPSLLLADVYSVIGYYLRHAAEVGAYLQQRRVQRDAVRQQNETRFDPHGVRERLLARRASHGPQFMLLLAADENFNSNIVRGLLRHQPALNIVRLQDVKLSGAEDRVVLAWAAQEGRVLLTHDVSSITRYAYERIPAGQPMPGVFEVSRDLPVGRAIEEILLLAECSLEREWEGQIRYLPLR